MLTKWTGQAWEELTQNEDMIARTFKICGISIASDGSEDFKIHLEGIEDYKANVDTENDDDMDTDDDDEEEDPFPELSGIEASEDDSDLVETDTSDS